MKYEYLVVGAGLFGSVVAHELNKYGHKVLVAEKDERCGGMVKTKDVNGIIVHEHGAHIFRTSNYGAWKYVNKFDEFMPYMHNVMANVSGKVYNLPFNLNTFNQLWGVTTPDEAKRVLQSKVIRFENPKNLEEWALSQVGEEIYTKFIKGYTEKQWGVSCRELPKETMKRIPIRFNYDNNYYSGKPYQGIPVHGYSYMIENMLKGIEVVHEDGVSLIKNNLGMFGKIIYTGSVDALCDYIFGPLGYRSLRFDTKYTDKTDDLQGCSVMNFPSADVSYTRRIEHKHFLHQDCKGTVVTYETPMTYNYGVNVTPYYPLLDKNSKERYSRYVRTIKETWPNIILGGQLGTYTYNDMEDTLLSAIKLVFNTMLDVSF